MSQVMVRDPVPAQDHHDDHPLDNTSIFVGENDMDLQRQFTKRGASGQQQ
jgi:hypothetical protein